MSLQADRRVSLPPPLSVTVVVAFLDVIIVVHVAVALGVVAATGVSVKQFVSVIALLLCIKSNDLQLNSLPR